MMQSPTLSGFVFYMYGNVFISFMGLFICSFMYNYNHYEFGSGTYEFATI